MIESSQVSATTSDVVYTIPNRAFGNLNSKGLVLLKLNQAIPSGTTTTLPVVLSSNTTTQPVTTFGDAAITASQITGAGVYLAYYDKTSNTMQLLTGALPS